MAKINSLDKIKSRLEVHLNVSRYMYQQANEKAKKYGDTSLYGYGQSCIVQALKNEIQFLSELIGGI